MSPHLNLSTGSAADAWFTPLMCFKGNNLHRRTWWTMIKGEQEHQQIPFSAWICGLNRIHQRELLTSCRVSWETKQRTLASGLMQPTVFRTSPLFRTFAVMQQPLWCFFRTESPVHKHIFNDADKPMKKSQFPPTIGWNTVLTPQGSALGPLLTVTQIEANSVTAAIPMKHQHPSTLWFKQRS